MFFFYIIIAQVKPEDVLKIIQDLPKEGSGEVGIWRWVVSISIIVCLTLAGILYRRQVDAGNRADEVAKQLAERQAEDRKRADEVAKQLAEKNLIILQEHKAFADTNLKIVEKVVVAIENSTDRCEDQRVESKLMRDAITDNTSVLQGIKNILDFNLKKL